VGCKRCIWKLAHHDKESAHRSWQNCANSIHSALRRGSMRYWCLARPIGGNVILDESLQRNSFQTVGVVGSGPCGANTVLNQAAQMTKTQVPGTKSLGLWDTYCTRRRNPEKRARFVIYVGCPMRFYFYTRLEGLDSNHPDEHSYAFQHAALPSYPEHE
jgi:hypothetical protein